VLLVVPGLDPEPWPTLGPQVCDLLEERAIYGPGSLQGEPYRIDPEFRAFIYRAFEVYPKGHPWEGRRRFKRAGLSVRKGLAKTEKMALLAFAELHPEGPTRFDGWDADGEPVGRPVRSPYIPMLAVTVEQVEELAYGALKYIVEEGPDADLFDSTLERIIRIDENGRADGRAVPLSNSPGSRDGARTTLNCFDEPHRLILPRQIQAHSTMDANLPKRPLDDPWSLYVGTAGEPGEGSVAEQIHNEALMIQAGKIERPDLFYLYRTDDDPKRDLSSKAERIKAVAEATGPAGEWGPGQFDEIASKWDRPNADGPYLERVWLNRWVKSGKQAFDAGRWAELAREGAKIPRRAAISLGFDGSRWKDTTGLVATDLDTGLQQVLGLWVPSEDDPVDPGEVMAVWDQAFKDYRVARVYGDPAMGWDDPLAQAAGKHGHKRVLFFYTDSRNLRRTAQMCRSYESAMRGGEVTHTGDPDFAAHIGAAQRRYTRMLDDDDQPLWVMEKRSHDSPLKIDLAMAGGLSWQARLDAIASGSRPSSNRIYTASNTRRRR